MKTMKEDYVSFNIAKLLREKGFDWDDSPFSSQQEIDEWIQNNSYSIPNPNYNADIPFDSETLTMVAPHVSPQKVMKWLRERHNIDIIIDAAVGMLGVKVYIPLISTYKPLKDTPSKVRQIKKGLYYKDDTGVISALQHFDSYEEAVEASIEYCLENLI